MAKHNKNVVSLNYRQVFSRLVTVLWIVVVRWSKQNTPALSITSLCPVRGNHFYFIFVSAKEGIYQRSRDLFKHPKSQSMSSEQSGVCVFVLLWWEGRREAHQRSFPRHETSWFPGSPLPWLAVGFYWPLGRRVRQHLQTHTHTLAKTN